MESKVSLLICKEDLEHAILDDQEKLDYIKSEYKSSVNNLRNNINKNKRELDKVNNKLYIEQIKEKIKNNEHINWSLFDVAEVDMLRKQLKDMVNWFSVSYEYVYITCEKSKNVGLIRKIIYKNNFKIVDETPKTYKYKPDEYHFKLQYNGPNEIVKLSKNIKNKLLKGEL